MAEVHISRIDAEKGGRLPAICMKCGAPAITEVTTKYSTDPNPLPPEAWIILKLVRLITWSSAKKMAVQTPLCHKHAHQWITWSEPTAKSITDDSIVLEGVSEQFAEAWRKQIT